MPFLEISPEASACRSRHSCRGAAARRSRENVFKSSSTVADLTGFVRFADGQYPYNLSGRALPDPSGTYRIEMTLPNGQVATASFGLEP